MTSIGGGKVERHRRGPSQRHRGMLQVRPREDARERAHQVEPAHRPDRDQVQQAVVDHGIRRHPHVAAHVLVVARAQQHERLRSRLAAGDRESHRARSETRHLGQHAQRVAQLAEALEAAVDQRGHGGAVPQAHHAQSHQLSVLVPHAEQVHLPAPPSDQRVEAVGDAVAREVPDERVAGAERKEPELHAPRVAGGFGEQPVEDFERGAVTADREQAPRAATERLARQPGGVAGCRGVCDLERLTRALEARAQRLEDARRAAAAAPAAGRRVDDRDPGAAGSRVRAQSQRARLSTR